MTDEEEKSLAFAADVMIEMAGYDEAFRYPTVLSKALH